ncbi:pyrroline-5-carboxylate reductase [Actinoplanes sp. NEAU-A12]|uniref:Pyrroline-5-carboxylate reductase n=1 Tax=Actinoplanes sandaracinus TaxID=3045177 RepID=A0ABT6WE17_9ACTN|nr:pyrroline-5-carboxylate reductase [Actinoplanes sandaracinus]MDI6097971.1 pyrroline-5-carboxylate reductase [Actinoplanes sandaracinus]
MSQHTVAVLGAGKMGELVLSGLLRSGHPAGHLLVTARRAARAAELAERYGVTVTGNAEAVTRADIVAVGVKPQDCAALLDEIAPGVTAGKLVVSLCAGLPTSFFAARLPEGTPVVRVMTNTPAMVGEAMSAISPGPHATDEHVALAESMFRPLGSTVRVPEYQQDAVTALSGSGPAYFYLMVEAMIEAGVLLGLPRRTAQELIVQTAVGSAAMLRDSGEHPVQLREAVTSPAGTTAAALREMENHGVRAALASALEAARDRAREIAAQAK